jgi:hypothetical protein
VQYHLLLKQLYQLHQKKQQTNHAKEPKITDITGKILKKDLLKHIQLIFARFSVQGN